MRRCTATAARPLEPNRLRAAGSAGPAELLRALVVFLALAAPVSAGADVPERDLVTLEALAGMSSLSEDLWPGWDIAATPFALHDSAGVCYLMHHPRPPIAFSRVHGTAVRAALYRAKTSTAGVSLEAGFVNDLPTAFLDAMEFAADPAATAVSAAFAAYMAGECPSAVEPVELVVPYPVDPRHVAMADIERSLLSRARAAPSDSLRAVLGELVSVREMRRVSMGAQFTAYEQWLEFERGIPLYMGERARALAPVRAGAGPRPGTEAAAAERVDLPRGPDGARDLDWYRRRGFARSGADVCVLLDGLGVSWQREVRRRCVDPYTVLREQLAGPLPNAADIFARYGLEERAAMLEASAESTKTDGERLFESVLNGPGTVLAVNTNLLSSVSVSFDRENIVRVDERREVHTRVIKVEYSGGTHVYLSGRPVAAVLEEGELAYAQFVVRAPDDLRVIVEGQPLTLSQGVYEAQRGLVVEGDGVSIQAASALVLVGERRVTLVLQQ